METVSARAVSEEKAMSESRYQDRAEDPQPVVPSDPGVDEGENPVDDLREFLEYEELMEEPTEGPLAIISDQDIPGEPG
jgi:hypothetical protein